MAQQITFRRSVGPHQALVLTVSGEVDLLTSREFREQLESALQTERSLVILDLSEVRFLTSAGLSVMVAGHELARSRGIILRLVTTQRAVLRPLEITGLNVEFTLFESVDTAAASGTPITNSRPIGLVR